MDNSKREFLSKGLYATSIAYAYPSLLYATNNSGCSAIERLLINAKTEENSSIAWASGTEPQITIKKLKDAISQLESELDKVKGKANKAQTALILSSVNTVGSLILTLAGIAATAPGAVVGSGAVIIGSVVFSGGMMLASVLTAPQKTDIINITTDQTGKLVGTTLQAMGDDAYALSIPSARSFAKVAGPIVGLGFFAYNFTDSLQKYERYSANDTKSKELRNKLVQASEQLRKITDARQLERLRRSCAQAVQQDLIQSKQINSCIRTTQG